MELVAQRDIDAATLLPIIQQHVRIIVWSDMWDAYNNFQHIPLWQNTRRLTTALSSSTQPQGSIPNTESWDAHHVPEAVTLLDHHHSPCRDIDIPILHAPAWSLK